MSNASVPIEIQAAPATPFPLSFHRYLPLAVLYFFFNSAGLPHGLTYTAVLSPVFYLWLVKTGEKRMLTTFVVLTTPFVIAHAWLGVASWQAYATSYLLLVLVYINVFSFWVALKRTRTLGQLFEQLIVLNFGFTLIAIAIRFTSLRDLLWID